MRLGLFGGSFDPIHHGHLIIARAVAEHFDMQRVILLPSRTPPHKPDVRLAAPEHRLAMVEHAIAGDRLFESSDYDLFWIIGADSLCELHTWYEPAQIIKHCRIVTAVRPGYEVGELSELLSVLPAEAVAQLRRDIIETPRIDISATDIRSRTAAGRSIRYLVPDRVREYVADHKLYT
jgi:nicotinate-nucleotide adenylyltransferase